MIKTDSTSEALAGLFGGDPGEQLQVVRSGKRAEISEFIRLAVWHRDGRRCRWCGSGEGRMTLDHIIPWSAGGSDRSDNLRVLCWDCNELRSNRRTDSAIARVLPVSLWCTRCVDRNGSEVSWRARWDDENTASPPEIADPVPAYCADCGHAGIADRSWTR